MSPIREKASHIAAWVLPDYTGVSNQDNIAICRRAKISTGGEKKPSSATKTAK